MSIDYTTTSNCNRNEYCVLQLGHDGGCSEYFGLRTLDERGWNEQMDAATAMSVITKIWNARTTELIKATRGREARRDELEAEVSALAFALDLLRRETRVYGPMF